jgi:hypothetical protein
MDLEHRLARAASTVVHEPSADVTARVSGATVEAARRQSGRAPAVGDGRVRRTRWRNGARTAAAVLTGAAVLAGAVLLAASHRQPEPAGLTTSAAASNAAASNAAASTPEEALTIVPADPADAARVAVTGASPEQLATILDVIAGLGPGLIIESVTLDENGPQGQRQLIVIEARSDPVGLWLTHVAADELVARLNRDGAAITWLAYAEGGTTVEGRLSPTADPAQAMAAGRASLDSAKAAGYRAEVTVYPIGALATVLHLEEPDYFAPRRTDWMHIAGGFDALTTPRFVAVEAPDGTRIFTSGHGTCYDCSSAHVGPTPGTPLPTTMAGPTVLNVRLSSPLGERPDVRIEIDCTGNGANGVLCDAIIRDRYALFQPLVSDTACSGLIGVPSIGIDGTLGGVPIDTGFGGCTSGAVQRWVDILRANGHLTGAWATDG